MRILLIIQAEATTGGSIYNVTFVEILTCPATAITPIQNMTDQKAELNIELSEQIAQGTYANLAIISHSTSEFVVDFVRMMPGMPKAQVKSRIILTPEHAKRLMLSLQDNISRYEAVLGKIEMHTPDAPPIVGFGGGEAS